MKKILLTGLFILSASLTSAVLAEDMKIAVVNLQEVIQKSPDYETLKGKLEKEFTPKQKKILESQKELQKDVEEFRRNESVLKEEDKKKLQEKIIKKQQELQGEEIAFQKAYGAAQEKAFQEILKKIKDKASKVAKDAKVGAILDKGAVLYADGPDLTDKMISALK